MKLNQKFFSLFSTCKIAEGHTRGIIMDLPRGKWVLVPNSLIKLFEINSTINVSEFLQAISSEEQRKILEEYFKVLEDFELGFWVNPSEKVQFSALNTTFYSASIIQNAIIDFAESGTDISLLHYQQIISELEYLGCNAIQLRCFSLNELDRILEILRIIELFSFHHVDLVLPYLNNYKKVIKDIITISSKTCVIVFSNSPNDEVIDNQGIKTYLFKDTVVGAISCGKVNTDHFNSNVSLYTESINFNSCLNKKISIDTLGNIKNCPSMSKSFGNIKDTTLSEAIEKPEFKKYWNINKDKIHVCKDCEFRYICTDCRAYVEDPKDIYSKPLKCGYNPYIGEWSEWSENPLKQKAIDFYGMREMVTKLGNE